MGFLLVFFVVSCLGWSVIPRPQSISFPGGAVSLCPETLAQLVERPTPQNWSLPFVSVTDFPRFPFRGFLHDTARHFLPVPTLFQLIDSLASAKYNVFHWHIVDDESFPYVSTALPKLSLGSFGGGRASLTYSPADVQTVISYAKNRGVRVIPEFDTPGHCKSWGAGYPEVVTECYSNGKPNGLTGPMNPTVNATFDVLTKLWNEIATVFLDDYVHLGGDEVVFTCWMSNPAIQAFMKAKGWTDYSLLEQFYEQRLIPIVQQTGKKYIVWQEIFDNGLKIDPRTIVDVWKDSPWQDELAKVTKAGYGAILSAPFYLNYIGDPYDTNDECKMGYLSEGDWCGYYLIEPLSFAGTAEQKARVLGGEGCMWGEYSSPANVLQNTWPKAAVVGERLWSSAATRDVLDMYSRLPSYTCELNRRGLPASPITGPGYCEWQ